MESRDNMPVATAAAITVCVYCASSEGVSAELRAVAAAVGAEIARRGWRLVYGGGGIGLMGEVARAAMTGGAEVIGVIPERLTVREEASPEITELHVVDTMRQRKHLMDSLADAFLILPGGIGTLEEFMEILTLRHLGYHDRPIVLLDPMGFWRPLRQQFTDMVAHGLATPSVLDLFETAATAEAAIDAVADLATPQPRRAGDWDAALGS